MEAVRFTWNRWPTSGLEAKRLPLPIACVVTPLCQSDVPLRSCEPLVCRGGCHSVFCRQCPVDAARRVWTCVFCHTENPLPPPGVAADADAALAHGAAAATVEYVLPRPPPPPPPSSSPSQQGAPPSSHAAFVFALDISVGAAELAALKDTVEEALGLLPQDARVGLVTFGPDVRVHLLSRQTSHDAWCPTAFVFDGSHDLAPARVATLLAPLDGLLVPLDECEFTLAAILESVASAPQTPPARPAVATGVMVAVVCGLLEAACRGQGARAILLCGNPCTVGPGKVVGPTLADRFRSHHDIATGSAQFLSRAKQHYDTLAARFAANGHCVDVFGCSLDQVGLHEMQRLAQHTGGSLVLCDSFTSSTFHDSLIRLVSSDEHGVLHMGFVATLEVVVSSELRVCGAMAHLTPIMSPDRKALASDLEIGIGGTTAWRLCCVDKHTSLTLFFDVVHPHTLPVHSSEAVVQLLLHYYTHDARQVLRVTTISRPWIASPDDDLLFDEGASAIVLARQTVWKEGSDDPVDILRSVDRTLIRLVTKHSVHRREDPSSFALSEPLDRFARIVYNFRRSTFMQTFNCSPDETAVANFHLIAAPADMALRMICPVLMRYTLGGSCDCVPLAASSVADDVVLVLDTFFTVVILVGHKLALLQRAETAGEDLQQLRAVLAKAAGDAMAIVHSRFPCPRYVECSQYSGNARFLLSLLDPETSATARAAADISQLMPSEDVSYQTFVQHLAKLIVNS